MNIYLELFLSFFKIGLFTFGGGYAMIPLIEGVCVDTKKWISHDDMMNITVIAESTPGPIATNCATFVGYKQKGVAGAAAATLGVILPSLAVICIIALLLDNFLEITVIANAFRGIKLAVGLLITDAAVRMIKKTKKSTGSIIAIVLSAVIMLIVNCFGLRLSTIVIMLAFGFVYLSVFAVRNRNGKESDSE